MKKCVIYVHGKGGSISEARHYGPLFADADVTGFDYASQTPWEAKKEFFEYFKNCKNKYDRVILIANSIGAFFSMSAPLYGLVDQALFISPVVNMENLINNMMITANVTEAKLESAGKIKTDFGETLSWEYLCYVRDHPIEWNVPTHILYGEHDALTDYKTVSDFAEKTGAALTVMSRGEHWFHTDVQMNFLDSWIKGLVL